MCIAMKCFVYMVLLGLAQAQLMQYRPGPHYDCDYCQPEQIHIAFGEKPNDITVTWSTFNDTHASIVQYGQSVMNRQVKGSAKLFVDGGKLQRYQYIHTAQIKGLKFNTTYVYHVGSVYGWSEIFSFKTPPAGEDWPLRAAIYGDMGSKNAHSLSYLQNEAQQGHFDMILHVGDFAYDMDTDNAHVGDEFMRQIQPLAATVPYMTCPGNHEQAYNFSNYAARFTMPGGEDSSLFYSWDLGPVHFVSISTEVYYFVQYGAKLIINQYEWLKKDLAKANSPENRLKRPWVIIYGHRPMYCSNSDDIVECGHEYTRTGFFGYLGTPKHICFNVRLQYYRSKRPWIVLMGHRPMYCSDLHDEGECSRELTRKGWFGLEPLLKEYGVDLVIWAHEHSYERTWPLYDYKVYNGSIDQPYVNPRAPVHVITGSAGCQEDTDGFIAKRPAWSAFRNSDYGYTRMVVYNKTHLYMEQVDVDQQGKVIDSFYLVKDKHTSYSL